MEKSNKKHDFIKNELATIIFKNDRFKREQVVDCLIKTSNNLDGFMSEIFRVDYKTKNIDDGTLQTRQIVVKVMKGDVEFREKTKSQIQFSNEIYIYSKVIPYYCKLTANSKIDPKEWIPEVYFGEAGMFDKYSDTFETILALEDLQPAGYLAGPRLDLEEDHLYLMARKIAQFHACNYAMRIAKDKNLELLINGVTALSFLKDDGTTSLYDVVYEIAISRLLEYIDRTPEHLADERFKEDITIMKSKYAKAPLKLMSKFLEQDEVFSVIQHGDYNRNNVLFKFDGEKAIDVKMIDFQETRYGSPALDISFCMYMNMNPKLRPHFWNILLKYYHDNLIESIADILQCDQNDERLDPYRFDEFIAHFSKFALYGGMVAVHFIPWMGCSEEECSEMSVLFETDMSNPKFKELVMVAGGDEINERITEVAKHCSKMGYMSIL